MSDPYSVTDHAEHTDLRPSRAAAGGSLRAAAWLAVVVSAVGNAVSSAAGAAVGVHLVFGLVTAACAAVLIAHRLRSGTGR